MNEWRLEAACRDADPELFFPISRGVGRVLQVREAQAICAGCPVREACVRDAAEKLEQFGIRAGFDLENRRDKRTVWRLGGVAPAQLPAAKPSSTKPGKASKAEPTQRAGRPGCGTTEGYAEHKRLKERACDACWEAHGKTAGPASRESKRRAEGRRLDPKLLEPCGTTAAYRRHKRRKEAVCDACRHAESQRTSGNRLRAQGVEIAPRTKRTRPSAECGTERGYRRHHRRKTTPCQPCLDAHKEKQAAYRASAALEAGQTGRRRVAECGTHSGYSAHHDRRETPCQPCKDAHTAWARGRRAVRGQAVAS